MAGALQAQVLLPLSHQTHDLPKPDDVICYYASDNRRGLFDVWNGAWQESGQPAGYGDGGILQNLDIGGTRSIWDWNAGGNNRNGSAGPVNFNSGGQEYYIGVKTDTNGIRYLDFDQASGYNASTHNAFTDDEPPQVSPSNGAENEITSTVRAGDLSWGMWFKYVKMSNGDSSTKQSLGAQTNNAPSGEINLGFYIQDSDSKIRVVGRNNSGTYSVRKTFSYVFSENTLYCIVLTLDQSTGLIRLYVDGSLEDSYTESTTINQWGYAVGTIFTGDSAYTTGTFCGEWYKSAWWATELTSTDVSTFYNNGARSPAKWS